MGTSVIADITHARYSLSKKREIPRLYCRTVKRASVTKFNHDDQNEKNAAMLR